MARTSDAIDTVTKATGMARSAVYGTARTLREHGLKNPQIRALWPMGEHGRGKGTQTGLSDIVNLMIGLAVADPIADVANLVLAYREAGYQQPLDEVTGEVPERPLILQGISLGEGMDWLVDALARATDNHLKSKFSEISVMFTMGEASRARVMLGSRINDYDASRHDADHRRHDRAGAAIRRTGELNIKHFELMAEVWADTLAHQSRSST